MDRFLSVQLKVEAIEFALRAFASNYETEAKRRAYLIESGEAFPEVMVYITYPEQSLKSEKKLLQEMQNLLLARLSPDNRMEMVVAHLKKCGINASFPAEAKILARIAKCDRNLEVGSVNTDLAWDTYNKVKEEVGTETRSCITNELHMKINGPAFEGIPFILSAHDAQDIPKLVKIIRRSAIRDGDSHEAESAKFVHDCIVPSEFRQIFIDEELSRAAKCRCGLNDILIMPWYSSTLNKHPSNCLDWIARQGRRILEALKYLHGEGYVHMDVKAANIFVDHVGLCYLGDFGSCKPVGAPITSCSTFFCWEDVFGKPAHPKYDYFMFLLMVLIECLEDRRTYQSLFYEAGARHANFSKVMSAAHARVALESSPHQLTELLHEILCKLLEFGLNV